MWFFVKAGVTDEDQPLKNSGYWSTGAIKKKSFNDFAFFEYKRISLKKGNQ